MRRNVALGVMLITTAAGLWSMASASGHEIVRLRHLHGLGYSADGSRLKIANHYGIAVYSDGRWSKAPGPAHDYMGFVVTGEFIISSGHPERSSSISKLLGLIRSDDRGQSWTSLGFEGEAEFHVVAAGHATNVVYVYNAASNSRMPSPGIYRRIEETAGWRHAKGRGLGGELNVLAAHPTEPGTIAAATTTGLFLSRDSGDVFDRIALGHVTAACFTLEGDALWFGTFADRRARLFSRHLARAVQKEIDLPAIGVDAVAYIAQNPVRRAEFAIASFQRSVFITPDSGKTWREIAPARGGLPR